MFEIHFLSSQIVYNSSACGIMCSTAHHTTCTHFDLSSFIPVPAGGRPPHPAPINCTQSCHASENSAAVDHLQNHKSSHHMLLGKNSGLGEFTPNHRTLKNSDHFLEHHLELRWLPLSFNGAVRGEKDVRRRRAVLSFSICMISAERFIQLTVFFAVMRNHRSEAHAANKCIFQITNSINNYKCTSPITILKCSFKWKWPLRSSSQSESLAFPGALTHFEEMLPPLTAASLSTDMEEQKAEITSRKHASGAHTHRQTTIFFLTGTKLNLNNVSC